jgi:hypothetical protein
MWRRDTPVALHCGFCATPAFQKPLERCPTRGTAFAEPWVSERGASPYRDSRRSVRQTHSARRAGPRATVLVQAFGKGGVGCMKARRWATFGRGLPAPDVAGHRCNPDRYDPSGVRTLDASHRTNSVTTAGDKR